MYQRQKTNVSLVSSHVKCGRQEHRRGRSSTSSTDPRWRIYVIHHVPSAHRDAVSVAPFQTTLNFPSGAFLWTSSSAPACGGR